MNKVILCIYTLTFMLAVIGCKSIYSVVKYKHLGIDRIKLRIPKNYVFEGFQGDHQLEHRYWYSDSSVIYITTFENTMNYEDIRKQGTYFDRFNSLRSKDSLTLRGVNKSGLFWQDKLLENGITIGYSRVPNYRLRDFNEIITCCDHTSQAAK